MKKFFVLFLSTVLLLSGCASSENSEIISGAGTQNVVSENIPESSDSLDKPEADGTDSVNSEDTSLESGAETSEESKAETIAPQTSENNELSEESSEIIQESQDPSESIPESEVLSESNPENAGGSDSSSVPVESTTVMVREQDTESSKPDRTESKPSVSTKKPEASAASTSAATVTTPVTVPDTAAPEFSEETPEEKPDESAQGFYVSGTKLFDANGNEFVMRGINHPHSWFKNQDETALAAIAKTGANCVRIVCSDGQQYTKDSADTLLQLVERCKTLEMIAILEVHDITGKDDLSALERTVDYWIEVKEALIGNEAYVMLNIANEWIGTWESDTWTKGYTTAIPRLREAGIKNTIIVDAAGWGQYAKSISDGGEKVFESDPLKNTMFSIHMYGSAGKNDRVIKQNLERVTEKGLCVIVGEFGHTHSDGDVDEAFIMKYCGENDIGYLGWSWKGNGGGVEYLDIALEWDGLTLSEDWGKNLIEGDTGIRKTSEKCSVF